MARCMQHHDVQPRDMVGDDQQGAAGGWCATNAQLDTHEAQRLAGPGLHPHVPLILRPAGKAQQDLRHAGQYVAGEPKKPPAADQLASD